MESDDFVAQDVAACGERAGDLDVPRVTVGDQGVRGILAGHNGAVDQTGLLDLEEVEGPGGRGAVAVDLGEVVDDRAVVGLGPGVPLQLEGVARLDGDGSAAWLRALVAGNVRSAKLGGLDETWAVSVLRPLGGKIMLTVVLVQSVPSGLGWKIVGRGIKPDLISLVNDRVLSCTNCSTYGVSTRVGLAVDGDRLDVTVSSDSRSEGQRRNSGDEDVLRERSVVHGVGVDVSLAMGRCYAPKLAF